MISRPGSIALSFRDEFRRLLLRGLTTQVVAVADGLYTLRYRTDDAWRGHEITRLADDLVPFGASLPRRAKPVTTYRED